MLRKGEVMFWSRRRDQVVGCRCECKVESAGMRSSRYNRLIGCREKRSRVVLNAIALESVVWKVLIQN